MRIKIAELEHINEIMLIFDGAVKYMKSIGNTNQWVDGYPTLEIITNDISKRQLYICESEEMEILAVFCYFIGDEPSYHHIDNGKWINNDPYGVVHRIASSGKVRHLADFCLNWCFQQHKNIRIDTHIDNITMKNVLHRLKYIECGTIYLSNGASRIAFQKTEL